MVSATPKSEISSPLRTLAFLSLAFDAVTAVLFQLTASFPTWGHDPQSRDFVYIPPQAYAMALAGFVAILLTITTGLAGLIACLSRGQRMWSLAFLVAFLLAIQGPIVFGLTLHDSSTLRLSQTQQTLSTAVSVISSILVAILALLYATWGVFASGSEGAAS